MFDYLDKIGCSLGDITTREDIERALGKPKNFRGFSLGKELDRLIIDLNAIDSDLVEGTMLDDVVHGESIHDYYINLVHSEYRFIHTDKIDEIQRDELANDEYILGCFNACFLAGLGNMPLDYDTIKTMQESEAFEAIGKIIVNDPDLLRELQEGYASADGYGDHFAQYDHEKHEIVINGELYHVFRTN